MEEIFRYIDQHKKNIVDFTKKIISIPTINPPGINYGRCVETLADKCRGFGLDCRTINIPQAVLRQYGVKAGYPRPALISRWQLKRKNTLHFNGHYDVVPPTKNWTKDPFKPVEVGARLYGRGSEDMKATIAAMIFAVEAVKNTGNRPRVNVEFSFVPDEETGGRSGLGYLVKKDLVKADYAIGEGACGRCFSAGNKGMLWLEVTVLGRSAHASEPYKGINSFEKMIKVANHLMEFKKEVSREKTCFQTEKNQDRYATMVMGGELWGGSKINIVPDNSTFTIDRRILPEEDAREVKAQILKAIHQAEKEDKQIKLKVKVLTAEPSVFLKNGREFSRMFNQAVTAVGKTKAQEIILCGGTDLRFFMRRGIPSIGYSVAGEHRAHSDDEFVYLKSLTETAKIFAHVLMHVEK